MASLGIPRYAFHWLCFCNMVIEVSTDFASDGVVFNWGQIKAQAFILDHILCKMVTHTKSVEYAQEEPNCRARKSAIHFSIQKFLAFCFTVNLGEENTLGWRLTVSVACLLYPEVSVKHFKSAVVSVDASLWKTVIKLLFTFIELFLEFLLTFWGVCDLHLPAHRLYRT